MSLAIFNNIPVASKINLVTLMPLSGVSRFTGYEYLGLLPYDVAKMVASDPQALVAATRAYFREGSQIEYDRITYVALRKFGDSPIFLIPEPLVQAGSVEMVNRVITTVRINGNYSRDQIAVILSSNGVTDYVINQEFDSGV